MDHHVAYSTVVAYAQLGQLEEALRWLSRAVDSGFPCYPWFEQDPLLEPLRAPIRNSARSWLSFAVYGRMPNPSMRFHDRVLSFQMLDPGRMTVCANRTYVLVPTGIESRLP
jgi:hypothetical protein